VWTSAITFVASANCAVYCGASVDFVDIDLKTYNMSTEHLEFKLARASQEGLLPKVVIPVHLAGQSCDMARIHALSKRYGFRIIEDASHALGATYLGEPVGSCRFSDITVFSFHPVKIITTGEGGIATTNDESLVKKMALYRSHGITRDHEQMRDVPHGRWYYEQIELGFNYRLTDIAAALGISQLSRLDDILAARHTLARKYDSLLQKYPVTIPWQDPDCSSATHLYIIRPDLRNLNTSHAELFERLNSRGIAANLHYIPLYRHPFYSIRGFRHADYPNAEAYYANAMSIPLYPGLGEEQQHHIVEAIFTPRGHQTFF
jgi:dTDP-4-amino-4,6-dideoxygalactose transaminase